MTGILSSPIIYVPHFDSGFVDSMLSDLMDCNNKRHLIDNGLDSILEYDVALGIVDFKTKDQRECLNDSCPGLHSLLQQIVERKYEDFQDESIFLFKNFSSALTDAKVRSMLQTFALKYERGDYPQTATIIITSPLPVDTLSPELESIFSVIDVKAPDEVEIHDIVKDYEFSAYIKSKRKRDILLNDICRNLQGLQLYDVKQILSAALVRTGWRLSEKTKELILEEKKKIVRKSGIIEVVDTDVSFRDIGGLGRLKEDLTQKSVIYKHLREAQDRHITLPKGILIIGMPGCGKSMIAKAVASEFEVSLLRLDISRLMGKYVGQSEANLRKALATAEAAHPCVLWIDEIEKAFAGAAGNGGDNMLVMRLMGHFLTWMQERRTPVFIVATANDVMRQEFMRKGRFDDVYFVNFPNREEREAILRQKLKKYESSAMFDLGALDDKAVADIVESMKGDYYGGFSGAEIESVVNVVFEKEFVEYMNEADSHSKEENYEPHKRNVSVEDFTKAVSSIKGSVMANQYSGGTDVTKKTNIERIIDMQRTYKFTLATEGNDVEPLNKPENEGEKH